MRLLLKFTVFAAAMFLGVQFAGMASWVSTNFTIPSDASVEIAEPREVTSAWPAQGVYVTYAGVTHVGGSHIDPAELPYLRFLAYNGTPFPINYSGYGPELPFSHITDGDGLVLGTFICGNGSTDHTLESGKTVEFRVGVSDFEIVPKKRAQITVGFFPNPRDFDESEVISSEPFQVPEEFRSAIRKYQQRVFNRDL